MWRKRKQTPRSEPVTDISKRLEREREEDRLVADLRHEADRWRAAGRKQMVAMREMLEDGREPCEGALSGAAKFYEQCDNIARRLEGEASDLRMGDLLPEEVVEHK
jgi:hypothetical protein